MKQNKFLSVLALAFVFGLAGCGPKAKEPCENGKHTWGEVEVVTPATCTEAGKGKHKCTVCDVEEETKIKATGHDYKDDATGKVDPTCTQDGSKTQTCSRCGDKKTVKLNATGHKWVDDAEGGTPATCTEAGTKNQTCSVCGAKNEGVVVEALGHDWGEYATVEGKAPTCEGAGEEKRVCARCNTEETRAMDPIGHKPVLQPGSVDPEAGKAAVRVYKCDNCGETSFGFKASEVSAESRDHLNFTEPDANGEVGASFWGRPIGNSLALDATGTSVNQQNNECVYCSTEDGDFFEYVFDLTDAQAAELATCRCYCDAMPADHLSGDFWAYNSSNTDWTPGYYIDGSDEHVEKDGENYVMVKDHARCSKDSASAGDELETEVKKGKRITNYRYILYVDGHPVDFDADTKVTVSAGVRKEYVMPYTFNLHAGTNRISLRMAGGYRSTFYNFIFRPYVAPTPVEVDSATLTVGEGQTATITSATMTGLTFKSDKTSVATVDENGVVTGVKAGTATITVSKEGNYKDAKVAVTVTEPAGIARAEVENGTSENDAVTFRVPSGSGCSGSMTNAFPKDAVLTILFNADAAGTYDMYLNARGGSNSSATQAADAIGVKINDNDVTLTGEIAGGYSFSTSLIGEVTLKAGENKIEIKALLDTMPNLDYFRFVPKAQA